MKCQDIEITYFKFNVEFVVNISVLNFKIVMIMFIVHLP